MPQSNPDWALDKAKEIVRRIMEAETTPDGAVALITLALKQAWFEGGNDYRDTYFKKEQTK